MQSRMQYKISNKNLKREDYFDKYHIEGNEITYRWGGNCNIVENIDDVEVYENGIRVSMDSLRFKQSLETIGECFDKIEKEIGKYEVETADSHIMKKLQAKIQDIVEFLKTTHAGRFIH